MHRSRPVTARLTGRRTSPAGRWPWRRLARLARRLDVDLVHSNSLHTWYGWAAAQLAAAPHVVHAREIVVQSGAALRVERVLCRRFATRVIAVSYAVAAQLDPANVVVLDEYLDPDEFSPAHAGRFRSRIGVPDDTRSSARSRGSTRSRVSTCCSTRSTGCARPTRRCSS